jgi:SRSO17 transposase
MAAAHVPNKTDPGTKPGLAKQMRERAIAEKVPFGWVAADSIYGVDGIKMALRRKAKGYVARRQSQSISLAPGTVNHWSPKRPRR